MKIKKMSVAELQAEITVLTDRIKKIQESCQHSHCVSIPGCSTGGYLDPDVYWTDFMCHNCLKNWRNYHD